MIGVLGSIVLFAWSVPVWAINDKAAIIQGDPLVIHFDNGKSTLGDADKAKIKTLLTEYEFGPDDTLLLVGHTDSSGDTEKNLKLSYLRARAVRREIISTFGISGKNILAMGRGEENPVGDNKSQAGRASNRRVEVYLAQVVKGSLKGNDKRIDVDKAAIALLVQDAEKMLRKRNLPAALKILQKARSQGGDQVGQWHAMYGMVGFYADAPTETIRAHLTTALSLDAFNQDARNYLGRLTARENVRSGKVTAQMGRDAHNPLVVMCDAEIYEYLSLFGAQPLSRGLTAAGAIQVWSCQYSKGLPVKYYFDRSQCYEWAFASNGAADAGAGTATIENENSGEKTMQKIRESGLPD